ncbi:MAG: NAD(P)H-hydrate dehydratase [Candidatus Omnitrophica bacterium]|nr:NAD(P)H-hydrate dehydratase [Candidatus Omnitrophota bacterium]MBU4487572.1 NAD(P)H-hydrate dehydratase [Candidatus Omnitrophota bacterium]MCG2705588.1 NAD(P)H-hydrate dehydratase [Candidatus Omnitrophota bacterium]
MTGNKKIKGIFKKRKSDTHKGDYGHVLVVAGSIGLTGAAYLASEAALVAGSGLVTCAVPRSLNAILASKFTEVMTLPAEDGGRGYFPISAFSDIMKYSERVDVVAIGPGLSERPETKELVKKLIVALEKPIVLDADGLNNIAGDTHILKRARKNIVITPHPGEMARLMHKDSDYIQANRKKSAEIAAKKYNAVVVLKGASTVIASPAGEIYTNSTGNAGMASAGAGDVLTGIIASLLGQGYKAFDAAKYGAYLHGLAGDIAAKEKGQASLRARDILDNISKAIKLS